MNIVLYDGSYDGLLTAIFEIYEYKITDVSIHISGKAPASLFGSVHEVNTLKEKAERVHNKIKEKVSMNSLIQLYKTFLSEQHGIENVLLRYMQYVLRSKGMVDHDYGNADVLLVQQMSRKVDREKHRMKAFIRFQLTKDGLYYAMIQPDYNVLPLISKHFEERYADQRWLIYDAQRKYGLYYDMQTVEEVQMNFTVALGNAETLRSIFDEKEELYQKLWQQYFSSVNIAARKNMKLHIQHMPKRYWRHLVEKQSY